jgi:hypothetical protein
MQVAAVAAVELFPARATLRMLENRFRLLWVLGGLAAVFRSKVKTGALVSLVH